MNYPLKQILGLYDPLLLRIQQEISWPAVNAMAQHGDFDYVKDYVKRQMSQQLANAIPLEFCETPQQDTLQISAEVYALTKKQLYELAEACVTLGSDQARVMPNFSNF